MQTSVIYSLKSGLNYPFFSVFHNLLHILPFSFIKDFSFFITFTVLEFQLISK